ncbi:aminoglycoside 6'-N-acetyltransferase [Sphingomonas bacterium]|uniref:aminoglycoside 6'-N-acetyltransferase n=1 Tax=Sphingomonas bacterium TaxID=1895847 RepID=UPI0020C61A47|nr:aminoglycoside 6'-N-acetyltransferase [Sphingomonas bacterium]
MAAGAQHVDDWARLRALLWADESVDEHRAAIVGWLAGEDHYAVVALDGSAVIGFAEASIRRDHVNGCNTSPVAFLEGLAVSPAYRRRGFARALTRAVEAWGGTRGCRELGSDADLQNDEGRALHRALGFEERERVVFYRKLLDDAPNGSTLS